MEYERIKAENEIKKLVQEAQEKVIFPSFLSHINDSCSLGKREACQY